jgi:hypothetical protein
VTTTIGLLAIPAVIGFSAVGTWIVLYWALSGPSDRDRIVREAHERAQLAAARDAIELAHAAQVPDPAWEAGLERLWDAIRDEQQKQKGEQA